MNAEVIRFPGRESAPRDETRVPLWQIVMDRNFDPWAAVAPDAPTCGAVLPFRPRNSDA